MNSALSSQNKNILAFQALRFQKKKKKKLYVKKACMSVKKATYAKDHFSDIMKAPGFCMPKNNNKKPQNKKNK